MQGWGIFPAGNAVILRKKIEPISQAAEMSGAKADRTQVN